MKARIEELERELAQERARKEKKKEKKTGHVKVKFPKSQFSETLHPAELVAEDKEIITEEIEKAKVKFVDLTQNSDVLSPQEQKPPAKEDKARDKKKTKKK